jgi:hypothetical protein
MKIHINYAHNRYIDVQKLNNETALSHGGFDKSIPCGLTDLSSDFLTKNSYTLSQPRGAGCWAWKPYIILKHLKEMQQEDWLLYTDSGFYFCANPWDLIFGEADVMGEKGIMTFGRAFTNGMYTKRDTFVLMGMDNDDVRNTPQTNAGVFVCRNTPFAIEFIEEWLSYAQDPRIITDLPNTQGRPNYPEFRDHRHDQSILNLLVIKHGTHVFTKKDIMNHQNKIDPCLIACGELPPSAIEDVRRRLYA